MNRKDRITINPKIMFGKPIITGTRIPVEIILQKLANGEETEEILKDYPRLDRKDIRAVLDYANKVVAKTKPQHAQAILHQISR